MTEQLSSAIGLIKQKLKTADKHNLGFQRFSVADMEAIWGVMAAAAKDQLAFQQKVNALAAENMDLKHPGTYLPSKRETPVTDAAANALRAEGAVVARNALVAAEDGSDIYATLTAVIEQLRGGKA